MTAERRSDRRGYSLIEMVLAIGGVTIIIGLCAGLLHTLLRLDRSGRESLNDSTSLARLARQFRQDVRASSKVRLEPDRPDSIGLVREGGPAVSYRVEEGRLLREEKDAETTRRREAFLVGHPGPVRFEVEGGLVRVVIPRDKGGERLSPGRSAVAVEARLGKDRTLASLSEAGE
jgi:hypothetical protein